MYIYLTLRILGRLQFAFSIQMPSQLYFIQSLCRGLGSYAALQQLYRIDTTFYLVIAKVEIGWARGCTKIVEYSNLISFINELENGKLKTSIQNECGE